MNGRRKRNKNEEITSKMAHLKNAFLICFSKYLYSIIKKKERLTAFQLNNFLIF